METIVRFVKLKEEAHIPVYGSDQAAGADLYACLEEPVEVKQGQTVFIPQGLVVFGIFTIIGGITAFGRIFDAFTDPCGTGRICICPQWDGLQERSGAG